MTRFKQWLLRRLFVFQCWYYDDIPKITAELMWDAYHGAQDSEWFQRYYGKSIFKASRDWMLFSMLFKDFLNDEGVLWIMDLLHRDHPPETVYREVRQFSESFIRQNAKPFIDSNDGGKAMSFEEDVYKAIRTIFTQQLAAFISRAAKEIDDTHCLHCLKGYYKVV